VTQSRGPRPALTEFLSARLRARRHWCRRGTSRSAAARTAAASITSARSVPGQRAQGRSRAVPPVLRAGAAAAHPTKGVATSARSCRKCQCIGSHVRSIVSAHGLYKARRGREGARCVLPPHLRRRWHTDALKDLAQILPNETTGSGILRDLVRPQAFAPEVMDGEVFGVANNVVHCVRYAAGLPQPCCVGAHAHRLAPLAQAQGAGGSSADTKRLDSSLHPTHGVHWH
jgi:hypothetical protein